MRRAEARKYALLQTAGSIRTALSCGDAWTYGGNDDAPVEDQLLIEEELNRIADDLEQKAMRIA